jgi:pyruvate-formate lyase-activating enzyme
VSERPREYLVRRISPRETYEDLLAFPRFFEIETVNACNARCPMCTITDWERGATAMTDALFDRIAGEISEHADHVTQVSLYRDGEPLIDRKLAERVAKLKRGGVRRTAISTNVSLLTPARSRELLEAGLDLIILSIDSLKKDVYEAIRKRLVFEEVMENALQFLDLRRRLNPGMDVRVRMIRQRSNYDEWPAFADYWTPKLMPHDRVYHRNIHNWGGQLPVLPGLEPIAGTLELQRPCVALWSLAVIFCNGDVPLCNVDYNRKHPTGSVLTHSIAELWRSKVMQDRRELHLTGKKACVPLCGTCNVWDEGTETEETAAGLSGAAAHVSQPRRLAR